MNRREDERRDSLVGSAIGPYIGWFAIVAVFGWPFFVFHGPARFIVGVPWLLMGLLIAAAGRGGPGKGKQP